MLLMAVSIFSCKKTDDPANRQYKSEVKFANMPPLMGGCIGDGGNLVSFSMPIIKKDSYSEPLITGKIHEFSSSGQQRVFHVLGNSLYYGSLISYNKHNVEGWLPIGARIDLAHRDFNSYFLTNNRSKTISVISRHSYGEYACEEGVTSVTSNFLKGAYFITAPKFSGGSDNRMITPPTIYEIDSLNNITEYFRFPSTLLYRCRNFTGSEGAMYPQEIIIDIASDVNNELV